MKTTFWATLISGFSLLFVSVQPVWAEQATSTPVQIVQEWINTYPHRLERAVMFTSPAMRKDLTPNQWIRAKKKLLAAVKLNYKNRQIVSVRNDGYQVGSAPDTGKITKRVTGVDRKRGKQTDEGLISQSRNHRMLSIEENQNDSDKEGGSRGHPCP